MWSWVDRNLNVTCRSPKELEGGCSEEGPPGWGEGRGRLDGEIPFGHVVYKPSIMSVCVSLKGKV